MKGFEPLTAGATVRSSTTELHPPRSCDYNIHRLAESGGQPCRRGDFRGKSSAVGALVHRTAAAVVHAARGLPARAGSRGAAVRVGGKPGQLLLQLGSMTLGTFRLLLTKYNRFKLVATLGAEVFKDRHCDSARLSTPEAAFSCHNGGTGVIFIIDGTQRSQ